MDGQNFYEIELLNQRELSILRVEAENEELKTFLKTFKCRTLDRTFSSQSRIGQF